MSSSLKSSNDFLWSVRIFCSWRKFYIGVYFSVCNSLFIINFLFIDWKETLNYDENECFKCFVSKLGKGQKK